MPGLVFDASVVRAQAAKVCLRTGPVSSDIRPSPRLRRLYEAIPWYEYYSELRDSAVTTESNYDPTYFRCLVTADVDDEVYHLAVGFGDALAPAPKGLCYVVFAIGWTLGRPTFRSHGEHSDEASAVAMLAAVAHLDAVEVAQRIATRLEAVLASSGDLSPEPPAFINADRTDEQRLRAACAGAYSSVSDWNWVWGGWADYLCNEERARAVNDLRVVHQKETGDPDWRLNVTLAVGPRDGLGARPGELGWSVVVADHDVGLGSGIAFMISEFEPDDLDGAVAAFNASNVYETRTGEVLVNGPRLMLQADAVRASIDSLSPGVPPDMSREADTDVLCRLADLRRRVNWISTSVDASEGWSREACSKPYHYDPSEFIEVVSVCGWGAASEKMWTVVFTRANAMGCRAGMHCFLVYETDARSQGEWRPIGEYVDLRDAEASLVCAAEEAGSPVMRPHVSAALANRVEALLHL